MRKFGYQLKTKTATQQGSPLEGASVDLEAHFISPCVFI